MPVAPMPGGLRAAFPVLLLLTVGGLLALTAASGAGVRAQDAPTPTAPMIGVTPLGLTPLPTVAPSPTPTPSPTLTPVPSPTVPLLTLTPPGPPSDAAFVSGTAAFTTPDGWSCGDFPCADDIDGFLQRIQVPTGYRLDFIGRYPGQPMQITYGPDGRLYATLITDPVARTGGVYAMRADGSVTPYGPSFVSPVGLAFQPGTDVLYVSARVTLTQGGGLWRVESDGSATPVIDSLPCCFQVIDNQPNGMVFGPDGYLYLGVASLTDRAEPPDPRVAQYAELSDYEAAVLRVDPHTGGYEVFAAGIRHPYDLAFDSRGQFYATDNGLLDGPGDRLLKIERGGHYGWPYWRGRGCDGCPIPSANLTISPDWLPLPDYTLPRGLTVYTGQQFPASDYDSLFVAFWHNTPGSQRVVRIDPAAVPTRSGDAAQDAAALREFQPEPFITGLIRPVDVTVAPDGSLVVADFIYGHIWRVSFVGGDSLPVVTPSAAGAGRLFVTSTPRP